MFRKYQVINQKCPVCKTSLGSRDTSKFFMAKCDDCYFYFSWEAGSDKPSAQSVKAVDKKNCGCESCRALGR